MPSPDNIFDNWIGIINNDLAKTILQTFGLSQDDKYVYRAESFAMTLPEIQKLIDCGTMRYKYQAHGQQIEVCTFPDFIEAGELTDSRLHPQT